MKKCICFIVSAFVVSISALSLTVEQAGWRLEISDTNGTASISKDNVLLIASNSAAFKLDESVFDVKTLTFSGAVVNDDYSDAFGVGKRVDVKYDHGSGIRAVHTYYLYVHGKYMLTELTVYSSATIASNYAAPVNTSTVTTFLPDKANDNAALIVPFDNDAWVRYASNDFENNTSFTSYEAGCLFNRSDRTGLVIGSIEHDNWKTGVVYGTGKNNKMTSLKVFGGIADNAEGTAPCTRDLIPHGKLKGNTIKSPKIFIGFFEDWRTGMETYADVNTIVTPKLAWNSGVPFGWNSWGNPHTNVSYPIAENVSKFFAENLQPDFTNDGTVYMSIDAFWDYIAESDREKWVADCKKRGQKLGIYWTPFSDWAGDDNRMVEGTNNQYTYGDLYLMVNGAKRKLDNGFALDPTHPGTKMRNEYYVNKFIEAGYEYYKIDFMIHGVLEADSHYDPKVTTGIQAYNQGFDHLVKYIDGRMFINLGIAPIFPSQYAHTRHICCESYGAMGDTRYQLNALSHAWWQDRLYFCNNPDVMVFGIFEENNPYPGSYYKHALGINRARMTSVVTTGMTLFGDDFLNCTELTRKRAREFARNKDITGIARSGKSFYPVEAARGTDQTDLYMYQTADTLYLAAYHFTSDPSLKTFSVNYDRIGLSSGVSYVVRELWTNEEAVTERTNNILSFTVPRTDARVFKIYPRK